MFLIYAKGIFCIKVLVINKVSFVMSVTAVVYARWDTSGQIKHVIFL